MTILLCNVLLCDELIYFSFLSREVKSQCGGQPLKQSRSENSRLRPTSGPSASSAGKSCPTASDRTGIGAIKMLLSQLKRDTGTYREPES